MSDAFVDPVREALDQFESDFNSPERAAHIAKSTGCVTNLAHGDKKLTIWKTGPERFRLEEFGMGGEVLGLTYDPLFQSLAAEMERLAHEVGALRRRLVDRAVADHRAVRVAEATAESLALAKIKAAGEDQGDAIRSRIEVDDQKGRRLRDAATICAHRKNGGNL
jgi:hypothetical protein